jgi:cell division protease FtsH
MSNKEILERITTRKQKLEDVKKALKEKFVGIDAIIDKVINSISLWYIVPEFQLRPCIISLWGTTGIGKTDLVRTLVNLLEFNDRFIEIQMDTTDSSTPTVQEKLEFSNINPKDPCILLCDELQRFRQLDEKGMLIENDKKCYNDIWMLLSDGKFASDTKRKVELIDIVLEDKYWLDHTDEDDEEGSPVKKIKKNTLYKMQAWTARRIKNLLKTDLSIEDIMKMDVNEKILFINESIKKDTLCEGTAYEKMLIFLSGNLDEAFKMSSSVDDADLDADIYHEFSKKINIINIKAALALKFKPEQIARFGNNHVIYPCLCKKDFYKIIEKRCNLILNNVYDRYNVLIKLDKNIYDIIYQNGVFPTQGVRPVLSTISQILDNNIPFFLFIAFENDISEMTLKYEDRKIVTYIFEKKVSKNVDLDIDTIKSGKSEDEKTLIIVHELGHALVYSLLFGTVPNQINFDAVSMANGFVMKHSLVEDKTYIRYEICTTLAGMIAEEIVFGENVKSSGSSSDISKATHLAASYVRMFAMDSTISKVILKEVDDSSLYNYNIDPTNTIIENILIEEKKHSTDLINEHMTVFKALISHSLKNKEINKEDFLMICKAHNLEIKIKEIKEMLIQPYHQKLLNFLNGAKAYEQKTN